MSYFYNKLGSETRTDMFSKTPYYPMNQMTKMGIRTDHTCRSDVPGLLVAGLAQAGCANHFAGFHIGMCIGTGWIAGRSAVEDLDARAEPTLDGTEVRALHDETFASQKEAAVADSDRLLRSLQTIMFACDVMVWKHADRLTLALHAIDDLKQEMAELAAPHVHELVRVKETEAMLLASEIILKASLMRNESRLSHFREDHDFRDDENWLCWVDTRSHPAGPLSIKTSIPTPLCQVGKASKGPVQRTVRGAMG
jgi:succinate dehydrogenase/fumarate reductase flavoprotein subunit